MTLIFAFAGRGISLGLSLIIIASATVLVAVGSECLLNIFVDIFMAFTDIGKLTLLLFSSNFIQQPLQLGILFNCFLHLLLDLLLLFYVSLF
jgi:hypothetical protein